MRERDIEVLLVKRVRQNGGVCLKWVSPGNRGVPDRIVLMPAGVVAFVELKAPGKHIIAGGLQAYWRELLQRFGFLAFEVNSAEDVESVTTQLFIRSRSAVQTAKLRQHSPNAEMAAEARRVLGEHAESYEPTLFRKADMEARAARPKKGGPSDGGV